MWTNFPRDHCVDATPTFISKWSRVVIVQSSNWRENPLKNKSILTIVLAFATVAFVSTQLNAQNAVQTQQVRQSSKQISFRLAEWKTMHVNGQAEATRTSDTLKQIGCEVVQSQHEEHFDVKFRCPTWKTMSLDTDQQVNQWLNWLVENGLDTLVRNPPANTKMPTVSYHLPEPVSAHMHDRAEIEQVTGILKMLGCKVNTSEHNGHIDVHVECSEWMTLGVTTEKTAHEWQAWLKSNGFETRHTHVQQ